MAERQQPAGQAIDQKPGSGIDRTVIRDLLVVTPEERVRLMIESARHLAEFLAATRRS